MKDGVAFLSQGTECERNRAVAQFNVARLAHDVVGVRDDKVGESAVVLLESLGALCVGLTGHLHAKVSKLLAELFDLGLGLEMLEGTADGRVGEPDGDGTEGVGVELGVSLHDVEGALRGEGVVVVVDTGHDFALFSIGIGGDGEVWALDGSVDGLGGRCAREWDGRWVDEGDGGGREFGWDGRWVDEGGGGGCEFGSDWFRGDGGLEVVKGGVGLSGRGHVGMV